MLCLRGGDEEKNYDPVYMDEAEMMDILFRDE